MFFVFKKIKIPQKVLEQLQLTDGLIVMGANEITSAATVHLQNFQVKRTPWNVLEESAAACSKMCDPNYSSKSWGAVGGDVVHVSPYVVE
jgi:hypothetical protein